MQNRLLFIGLGMMALVGLDSHAASPSLEPAEIYHDYCSVCHGDSGNGRSRASGSFFPAPRDFTTPVAAKELTRNRMIFSVTYGRPNTAMPSWGVRLSKQEVESVVDYVRKTFMTIPADAPDSAEVEATAVLSEFDPTYMEQPMPYGIEGKREWGKLFYESFCAECHGVTGDGKGPRAYFILPKPRDYKHAASRHKYNRPELFKAIAVGKHGSVMPAWEQVLTHQELAHVTEYIFASFIQPVTE